MRKDLRYGLGIGALLLVFIVTFLLVRKHTENQNARESAAAGGRDPADEGVEGGPTEANPTALVAAGDTPVPNAAASLPPLRPMPVGDVAQPGAGRSPTDDPFAERDPARPGRAVRPAAANKTGTVQDWDRLLSEGWPGAGAAADGRLTATPVPPAPPSPITSTPVRSNRPSTVVVPPGRSGLTVPPPPAVQVGPRRSTAVADAGREPAAAALRPMTTVGSLRDEVAGVSELPGRGELPVRGELPGSGSSDVAVRTGRPYTVAEGDTFVSIAKAAFGNTKYFLQIERANPSVDPARLQVGQQIVLPELTVEARAAKDGPFDHDADNRPINPRTEYRVDVGDSLYRIAQKLYGTHRMSGALYEANRAAIGPVPERLRLGMILKLPQSLASN